MAASAAALRLLALLLAAAAAGPAPEATAAGPALEADGRLLKARERSRGGDGLEDDHSEPARHPDKAGPGRGEQAPEVREEREEVAEEKEEVEASRIDLVIACMLLGSVIFAMTLFQLLSHPDPDIKLHSYMILSFTISIFIAVLVFHGLTSLLHGFLGQLANRGLQLAICVVVKLLEALVLYAGLQVVIWHFVSGASDSACAWSPEVSRRASAWCTLLTHICAFATISCIRDLQSLLVMGGPAVLSFLPAWLSVALCFGAFRLADYARSRAAVTKEGHEKWDAVVEETENDLAGLVISFVNVQAIIDCISGPPLSAYDKHGHLNLRDQPEVGTLTMFGTSLLFAALTVAVTWYISIGVRSAYSRGRAGAEDDMGEFISYAGFDTILAYLQRWLFILQTTCAMSFAWCLMFTAKWQIAKILGSSGFILHSDSTGQSAILALAVSFTAFGLIFILDAVQDLDATGEVADRCTRSIMGALAILIGFSWEQAFDRGLEVIAELSAGSGIWFPIMLKLLFVGVVAIVLVPVWSTHILKAVLELKEQMNHHERTLQRSAIREDMTEIIPEIDGEEVAPAPTWFCFVCNGPKKRDHAFQ